MHLYIAPDENFAEIGRADAGPAGRAPRCLTGWSCDGRAPGGLGERAGRQYYHAMDIGTRLAVVPSWEAVRNGPRGHHAGPGHGLRHRHARDHGPVPGNAGRACVQGGERVLDIGTGSGILAIAALKLGAAEAEGVDIDPMCVRTAGENAAAQRGAARTSRYLLAILSDKASGHIRRHLRQHRGQRHQGAGARMCPPLLEGGRHLYGQRHHRHPPG